LLSSTDVQIDGTFMLPGTTLQYVRGDGSLATYTGGGLTSVGLTLGSAGTDAAISGSPLTANGSITLNLPSASATNRGLLTSADWSTFNSKESALTFSSPLSRTTNTISIPAATSSVNGYLTSTDWTTFNNKLSSVGITMPSAFTVTGSPLTANGTIAITGAGLASQYVRGDGTLANFPTSGGGGSSVSYYMNGSVSQGAILGNTYYELNKTPVIGAGTDFTINANGYITQFITDANDPALLEIPGGNWNFEMYFSASSGGGSPSFYLELYKYNGTAFTLIASSSATPEGITNGTAIDLYTTALAVPQTVLTITDRLAIRVYVTHSGRTITLHTENSHLCQVITTFSTGLTALNSLTKQVQYLAVGTSGTDFAISSVTDTHTFNLPTASGTNRGALSSADWTTFNGKESVLTFSSPLSRTTNTISIPAATSSVNGYLTSADWTIFNGKGSGTVTSVAALTLGTTGTDLSSTVATGTTTPVITLNVPTASATNRGALSSADWTTFNGKQALITGGATTITTSNLTISRALVSDGSGKVSVATTTATEIGYVNGVTSAIQTQLDAKASKTNVFNAQGGTTYTLVLADSGKIIEMQNSSPSTVTIPLFSSVAFPVGTEIQVLQFGSGQVTIAGISGVTTRSKSSQLKIGNQFTGVTLVNRATNDWYVIGNTSA
jgi:hypothetical protein